MTWGGNGKGGGWRWGGGKHQPCQPSYNSVSGTRSVGTCLLSSSERGRSAGRSAESSFFLGWPNPPPLPASNPPPSSKPPGSMGEGRAWHAYQVPFLSSLFLSLLFQRLAFRVLRLVCCRRRCDSDSEKQLWDPLVSARSDCAFGPPFPKS